MFGPVIYQHRKEAFNTKRVYDHICHKNCHAQQEMHQALIDSTKSSNEPTAGGQKDNGHGRGLGWAEHGSYVTRRVHWCDLPRMPFEAGNRGLSSSCLFKFCILDS